MATIASVTVTLRGKVASRVVSLTANGVAVTLTGTSFAHPIAVTPGDPDRVVVLTTVDNTGRAESRVVRLENGSVPYVAPVSA